MNATSPRPVSFGRGSVATWNRLTLSDSLGFDEWVAIGGKLAGLVDASAWWIGDWIFFGQWQYGKKYLKAVEVTGLDEGTLRNYASVAGRFELSRRRDDLTFGHHAAVVSLPLADADKFLARAAKEKWSVRVLRDEVRSSKAVAPAPPALGPSDAPIPAESLARTAERETAFVAELHFDLAASQARTWAAAAAANGQSLRDWAISVLDTAAAAAAAA